MEREKIIALIAEDMKHNSLINGLESIGITDNDHYTLSLDMIVAKMMGHVNIPDKWLTKYQSTMLHIPHSLSQKEANSRAVILLDALSDI